MGTDKWLLGLMSGTSMDGIDAALIKSDGHNVTETGATLSYDYTPAQRTLLEGVMGEGKDVQDTEAQMTRWHHDAVMALLDKANLAPDDIELIGFHGQTTFHDPSRRITIQIGDGDLLAKLSGIPVINDFRKADVAAGGEGAPFAPLYHQALAQELEKPLVVLNIGGVSNVTIVGANGELLATDCGPGNGVLDTWVERCGLGDYDKDGALSLGGTPDFALIDKWLTRDFFQKPVPKSADRWDFDVLADVQDKTPQDGAATLVGFTAMAIAHTLAQYPHDLNVVIVCGGGRKNPAIMAALIEQNIGEIKTAERLGWQGDDIEAQAFAYLAVRTKLGLPISFPLTTGVPEPMTGGRIAYPM